MPWKDWLVMDEKLQFVRTYQLGGVDHIAEILNADFAGEEAIGCALAQSRKEFDAGTESRVLLNILTESNQIEDFFLHGGTFEVDVAVALNASGIQPHDPAPEL